MVRRLAFALACILSATATGPALAQSSDRKLFELGASQEEVWARFGKPKSFYVPRLGHNIPPSEYPNAISFWGIVHDVYTFRTDRSEYEVRVGYMPDSSESKLHPKLRVSRVEFIADKPAPADTILNDLAEARALCQGGCSMLAKISGYAPFIMAFPSIPSDQQLVAASVAAGARQTPVGSDYRLHYVPSLQLTWDEAISIRTSFDGIPWGVHPIESVVIQAGDPEFEQHMSKTSGGFRPLKSLGSWQPKPSEKMVF
jgi:hypothetical protein